MSDPHLPPEFVAAEAWKVLLRPQAQPRGTGDADEREVPRDDAADGQEARFWEASWTAT